MKNLNLIILLILGYQLFSCNPKTEKQTQNQAQNSGTYLPNYKFDETEKTDNSKTCKLQDGLHKARVFYYNKKTNYSNTYDLEIEVKNCQVSQINFENGGYLDKNHINSSSIDPKGKATVTTDDNKTYKLNIQ